MIRAGLLYAERELGSQGTYEFSDDIIKDLNLNIIFKTMAKEDFDIQMAARRVMLVPLHTEKEILYRQAVIQDVLKAPRPMAAILHSVKVICATMENRQGTTSYKRAKLIDDLNLLTALIEAMIEVREQLRMIKNRLESEGFRRLLDNIEEYDWDAIRENTRDMNFMSKGGELILHFSPGRGLKMEQMEVEHCVGGDGTATSSFTKLKKLIHKVTGQNVIYLEDEHSFHDARELEEAAMQHLMNHYDGLFHDLKLFFKNLLVELSFYMGCYFLHSRFQELGIPFCMPTVWKGKMAEEGAEFEKRLFFQQLYELTLAIYSQKRPVSNDMAQVGKRLYVITGANQGGKSTFLRSIAIAQVMMQCGMFVPAKSYTNRIYDNIFTHFTRREDEQLNSGRLEEEINRMSKIISRITADSMVVLNESFASTTEKEGSVIAADIVRALYEADVDVYMVTHLFEFARNAHAKNLSHAVFLTAERKDNGERTYKMLEHEPNHTSYGLDLYDEMI